MVTTFVHLLPVREVRYQMILDLTIVMYFNTRGMFT